MKFYFYTILLNPLIQADYWFILIITTTKINFMLYAHDTKTDWYDTEWLALRSLVLNDSELSIEMCVRQWRHRNLQRIERWSSFVYCSHQSAGPNSQACWTAGAERDGHIRRDPRQGIAPSLCRSPNRSARSSAMEGPGTDSLRGIVNFKNTCTFM